MSALRHAGIPALQAVESRLPCCPAHEPRELSKGELRFYVGGFAIHPDIGLKTVALQEISRHVHA